MRIHTGEKPFVCAVCSRGYRDRRELKKHQTTHNHSGQSAPIPGTGPITIPPPNTANSNNIVTKTIVVQQPVSPQQQHGATIVTSPTTAVNLPIAPVPKELLNINGHSNHPVVIKGEPLNPATIPLPPSVASALQQINDKVTARQQRAKQQLHLQEQQQVVVKSEPLIMLQESGNPSVVTVGGGQGQATGSSGSGSGNNSSNGPLFYYLMPNSVQYSLTQDSGTTVQVKTSDGSIATAQLVTVPSNSIQSSGGTSSTAANSNSNWILETAAPASLSSSAPASGSRNSM